MLFVCLSHFAANFLAPWSEPGSSPDLSRSSWLATTISMIASPTFVAVSGLVIGFLGRVCPAGMPELRRKLIDRGLFLLIIGHFIQVPAYGEPGKMSEGLRVSFITDVIAVAIIVGPTLVARTSGTTRLAVGALILILNWLAAAFWTPVTVVGLLVARYGLGMADSAGSFTGFPVLPWLAIYLLMTTVGERLGEYARASQFKRAELLLLCIGGICVTIGSAFTIARHGMRVLAPEFMLAHGDLAFLAASRKWPPGPGYLLFFGGAGLMLVSRAFVVSRSRSYRYVTEPLSAFGRASFFVFVLQGYLYYLALPAIRLPFPQLWPAYYALTILLLLGAANFWNRIDGNRFLTVGLWQVAPLVRSLRAKLLPARFAH